MRQIPTGKFDPYIKYADEIFIIELNNKGNKVDIQMGGVDCLHRSIKGFVFKTVKSDCKWFKPYQWNKRTVWGENYPKDIYFHEKKHVEMTIPDFETAPLHTISKTYDHLNHKATFKAKPAENILHQILTEVRNSTKVNFEYDQPSTDYGVHWFEAFIPLTYKGKDYILTWQNCD